MEGDDGNYIKVQSQQTKHNCKCLMIVVQRGTMATTTTTAYFKWPHMDLRYKEGGGNAPTNVYFLRHSTTSCYASGTEAAENYEPDPDHKLNMDTWNVREHSCQKKRQEVDVVLTAENVHGVDLQKVATTNYDLAEEGQLSWP